MFAVEQLHRRVAVDFDFFGSDAGERGLGRAARFNHGKLNRSLRARLGSELFCTPPFHGFLYPILSKAISWCVL